MIRYNYNPDSKKKRRRIGKNFYRKQQALLNQVTQSNLNERIRSHTDLITYTEGEAFLQHYLFHCLLQQGINSIPQFVETGPDFQNRYDLMILDKTQKPLCIVEVKPDWRRSYSHQVERYETTNSFKVPVFLLAGRSQFDFILQQVVNLFHNSTTIPS